MTNVSVVTPVPSGRQDTIDDEKDHAVMTEGKASHAEVLAASASAAKHMQALILYVLERL